MLLRCNEKCPQQKIKIDHPAGQEEPPSLGGGGGAPSVSTGDSHFGAPETPGRNFPGQINTHLLIHSSTVFFCASSAPSTRNSPGWIGPGAYPQGDSLGGRQPSKKSRTRGPQCCDSQMHGEGAPHSLGMWEGASRKRPLRPLQPLQPLL